jgi:hypothetical protein
LFGLFGFVRVEGGLRAPQILVSIHQIINEG